MNNYFIYFSYTNNGQVTDDSTIVNVSNASTIDQFKTAVIAAMSLTITGDQLELFKIKNID